MSPDEQTQQDWSNLLANEKLQHQQMLRVPIAVRQKQIDDQLAYYKGVLEKNIISSTTDTNEVVLKKLIELRATQTVLNLLATKEARGHIGEIDTQREMKRYVKDCLELVQYIQ